VLTGIEFGLIVKVLKHHFVIAAFVVTGLVIAGYYWAESSRAALVAENSAKALYICGQENVVTVTAEGFSCK